METGNVHSASVARTSHSHGHNHNHARVSRAIEEDSQESAGKYRRYEKEYLRRINHKYFSGLTFSGEPVFESSVSIDGILFKESKDPPLKKFSDGPSIAEEHTRSASLADAVPSSRKTVSRKN